MIKRYKTQKFDKARVMFAKVFVVMLLCCFYVVCALLLLYFQKTRLSQYMTQISTDSLITSRLQVGIDLVLLYGLDPDFPMANGTVQENTERAILDVSNHDLSSVLSLPSLQNTMMFLLVLRLSHWPEFRFYKHL